MKSIKIRMARPILQGYCIFWYKPPFVKYSREAFFMLEFGIDSLGVLTPNKDYDEVIGVKEFWKDKREDGKEYLLVKPSLAFNNTGLSTLEEVLIYMKYLRGELGEVDIKRFDTARDIMGDLEEKEKLFTLYLELLAVERGNEGIFRTEKNIVKTGNLKIDNRRRQTVVYCSKDKNREADIRLEERHLNINNSNKDDKKRIEEGIKKNIEEMKSLLNHLEIVEKRYIKELAKHYKKQIQKGEVRNFTDFVVYAKDKVLTVNILKGLYKEAGLKGRFTQWLSDYRKNRELNLVTNKEIKSFIKENIKGFKSIVKS